jgi:hypothetical protein
MTNTETKPTKHVGSCHCGDVRFEAVVDASFGTQCNCTICQKTHVIGASIKPEAFTLLSDPDKTATYAFGPVGIRHFCKRCGIHVYGTGDLPQLGGKFVSVYLNVLDDVDLSTVKVAYWDGRHNNWQAGMRDSRWPTATPASA